MKMKDILTTWMGRFDIIKTSIHSKLTYKFNKPSLPYKVY